MHHPLLRRFTDMLHWKIKLAAVSVLATAVAASGGAFFPPGLFKVLGTFW